MRLRGGFVSCSHLCVAYVRLGRGEREIAGSGETWRYSDSQELSAAGGCGIPSYYMFRVVASGFGCILA